VRVIAHVTSAGATMRVEHRFAALLLALTMVGACTSEDALLRVDDDRLVDPSGERVVLQGATLYSFPFYLSDGKVDRSVIVESERNVEHLDRILDRMVELGFDTVRVPLAPKRGRRTSRRSPPRNGSLGSSGSSPKLPSATST